MQYQKIVDRVKSESYLITSHARTRMAQREISTFQLEEAILFGEIIESYEDDEPCPSYLLLSSIHSTSLHIVIGMCTDHMRIITCYYPDENEWINYRERKR